MRTPGTVLAALALAGGAAAAQCPRCGGNHHASAPTQQEAAQVAVQMQQQGAAMMEAFEQKAAASREAYQGRAEQISREQNAVEQAAQADRARRIGTSPEPPPPGARRWPGPPPPPEHREIREGAQGILDQLARTRAAEAAARTAEAARKKSDDAQKTMEDQKKQGAPGAPNQVVQDIKNQQDKAAAVLNGPEAQRNRIVLQRGSETLKVAEKMAQEQPKAVEKFDRGEISFEKLKEESGMRFDTAYPSPLED